MNPQTAIQLAEKHMTAVTDVATKEPFTVVEYGYSLVGNFSLGSPAQNFTLYFDFFSPNLYVVDANAMYYDSQNASNNVSVSDKQTYDASVTSSCVSVNSNFSTSYVYKNGSVVSDVLQVGDSLQATVTPMPAWYTSICRTTPMTGRSGCRCDPTQIPIPPCWASCSPASTPQSTPSHWTTAPLAPGTALGSLRSVDWPLISARETRGPTLLPLEVTTLCLYSTSLA